MLPSSSSLFMARVQDAEPRFNSSIFAISAVSGGAIGTGLYQGFASGHACKKVGASENGEAPAGNQASIEEQISKLVLKPHLAPIIGNIPADVVRSVMSIVSVRIDRSEAFRQSLLEDCPALNTPYDKYWDPAGARPALILNTTWMSNGHRVAFAPFPLKAIGDGTLWSFDDVYQGLHPLYHNKPFTPSVADAVIASARFPAVLPPLGLTVGAHRHNFGDGGYADASGVTTALEIFQAAKRLAVKDPKIVPRLVMLTFDYEKVEAEKEDGTTFGETVAPIGAILGVRENLAGQAITRAQALPGAEGEISACFAQPR